MIKKLLTIFTLVIVTGCSLGGKSYPNNEGHYIINSINIDTAYVSDDNKVEIMINDIPIEIYSMQTENEYGCFSYTINEETKPIECLNSDEFYNCFLAYSSITEDEDKIIGLLEVARSRDGSFQSFQRYLEYDLIFELNPLTDESEIIYKTAGNYQRIVGYNKGKVYLYENNCIYELDLATNKKALLKTIEPYEKLEFDWINEGLTIDNIENGYHELVEI